MENSDELWKLKTARQEPETSPPLEKGRWSLRNAMSMQIETKLWIFRRVESENNESFFGKNGCWLRDSCVSDEGKEHFRCRRDFRAPPPLVRPGKLYWILNNGSINIRKRWCSDAAIWRVMGFISESEGVPENGSGRWTNYSEIRFLQQIKKRSCLSFAGACRWWMVPCLICISRKASGWGKNRLVKSVGDLCLFFFHYE